MLGKTWSWLGKHRRLILCTVLALLILVLVVQIFWPARRSKPLTYWGTDKLGVVSKEDINGSCEDESKTAQLVLEGKDSQTRYKLKYSDVGAILDCEEFSSKVVDYPFISRLIPFSILKSNIQTGPSAFFSEGRTKDQVQKVKTAAESLTVNPVNASIAIKSDKTNIKSETRGVVYDSTGVEKAIVEKDWDRDNPKATVSGRSVEADISKSQLVKVEGLINERMSKDFIIENDDHEHVVNGSIIGSWINLKDYGDIDSPKLKYYQDSVSKYLKDKTQDIEKDLQVSNIDISASSKNIVSALEQKSSSAEITIYKSGRPSPIDATPESIKNYVSKLESSGESIAVFVKKIGSDKSYDINADRIYTSASTYKLFVAYSVAKRIDSGSLSWSSPVNGTTVEACTEKMIVLSDNACPEAFLARYGFATIQNEGRAIGASNISFSPGNMRASARDLSIILERLGSGRLLSSQSTKKILDYMGRQVYRQGVPSGTSYSVEDKVGFLNALLHDAAIIESPQGRYVVVIMTDNSSWGRIAELTRMIVSTL